MSIPDPRRHLPSRPAIAAAAIALLLALTVFASASLEPTALPVTEVASKALSGLDGNAAPEHGGHALASRPPSSLVPSQVPSLVPTRQAPAGSQPAGTDSPPAAAAPPVVKVQLEVIAKTVDVLGVPTEIWTYGGTVPGTIIRVTEGTLIEVTLVNGHSQTHSIHTHFRGNLLASDGSSDTAPLPMVPHQHNPTPVQQNPIGPYEPRQDRDVADPGQSYTYTFFADTPGNFLYHCHVFLATDHIGRGLFGMFVVYPTGWTWEDLPADELNGNTKARVTDDLGRSYFEDVVMISEVTPASAPTSPVAIPANPVLGSLGSEYPTAVPTSGFTPAATGKINVANYRAWNDPYIVGPVQPNERIILRVANIGDEMHDWHVHSHWFDVIDKTSREKKPLFTDDTYLLGPGDSIETQLTAGNPGYWFMHDHIVPAAYTGMVPWLWVEGEPVPNVAPDVWVDNLVAGQVVAGNIPILGRADNFEGREMVKSIEVQVDGGAWQPVPGLLAWRYIWDTRGLSDGEHQVAFRASDGIDYSKLEPMSITVRNSAAPSSDSAAHAQAQGVAQKESPGLGLAAIAALAVVVAALRRR